MLSIGTLVAGAEDYYLSVVAAREQSPRVSQHDPVCWLQCRTVDLASKYDHLMGLHDHVDRETGVVAAGQPDQLEDATQSPLQEREDHRWMLAS